MLFAGPGRRPGRHRRRRVDLPRRSARRWRTSRCRSASSCARENLVLRADLLRPWANWVTPKEERTRRYDTYFFVGALPEGQRADGDNTETDQAGWITPEAALDDFADGAAFLLPPTWTQLDSLNGRTVAEVLAVRTPDRRRRAAPRRHDGTATGRSSSSTATATTPPATAGARGYGPTRRLHERVRLRPHQRRAAGHRHPAAVATADQRADPSGVPRDRLCRSRTRCSATTSARSSCSAATRSSPPATTCPSCRR